MVNFYKRLVIAGLKKYTDVPWLWNDSVQEALKDDGYTLKDDGTVTKAETEGAS